MAPVGASHRSLIIAEARISQWGGDFRRLDNLLDQLRGLMPLELGSPVHSFSATLAPDAPAKVVSSLSINTSQVFGNDPPNITPFVVRL
jgi:superfamily II DNA helicase RecQ